MSHRPPGVSSELSRDLTLFQTTMMGLGMMIGAGVFFGTGVAMAISGPGGVMLTFALGGLIALFTAMSYAELSSAIPKAGGAYNFARLAFGRGTSFVAGWMEWFASSVAGSLYAVCFATYTVRYLGQLGLLEWLPLDGDPASSPLLCKTVAIGIGLFFLYINYRGASETGRIGAIMTLLQTLFLVFIGGIGVWIVFQEPERLGNFSDFMPDGWTPLLVTMGFTAVAFEGYEVIAQAGDETIHPRRNIPRAMLYSVLIVTVTYVVVAFATVVSIHPNDPRLEGAPVWEWIGSFGNQGFAASIETLMPKWGGLLLTLAVIFASTSALNATIYSATRASYALGRDRMLPAFFERISEKRKTPWVALLFTGGIVLVTATALPTEDVVSSASIMFLCLFFLVNICAIKIRRNMSDELTYGYVMPLFPLFPVLAIICQATLAAHLHEMSHVALIIAPVWIGIGVVFYYGYSKSRAVTTSEEILVLEEESVSSDAYRVMVAVANPDNALALVRNTYRFCRAKEAHVELLHMVPVPDQVPLTDAHRYMTEGKEGITEASLYLAPGFDLSTTFRYCRNAARGILGAVRERRADLLILGWSGVSGVGRFRLGSTIDPILERAPCKVVVLKSGEEKDYKRVLAPIAGGPNAAFALEAACILADQEEGEVVVFTAFSGSSSETFDLDAFVAARRGELPIEPARIRTKKVEAANPVMAILDEASDYDLVVIGATRQGLLSRISGLTAPDMIARMHLGAVAIVQAPGRLRSWVDRWF